MLHLLISRRSTGFVRGMGRCFIAANFITIKAYGEGGTIVAL